MDVNNQGDDLQTQTRTQVNVDDDLFEDGVSYQDIIDKDILDLMGFTTLTPEKEDELRAKVNRAIEDRVGARIFDTLAPADRDAYKELLDQQNWAEANNFLSARQINANKWLAEEAVIMKMELYEDSRFVKKKAQEEFDKQKNAAANTAGE